MNIRRSWVFVCVAAASAALALPASAGNLAAPMNTAVPIYLGSSNMLSMIGAARTSTENYYGKQASGGDERPGEAARAPDFGIADDAAVSEQARQAFLSGLVANSGQAAADEVDQRFGNIRTTFRRVVSPYGLSADNFADVMTAYVVIMWMAANRQVDLPQVAQVQGVRRQMQSALAGKLSDAAKRQLVAETMMYQTCVAVAAREEAQAKGNVQILDQLSNALDRSGGNGAQQLRQMALTNQGLVSR